MNKFYVQDWAKGKKVVTHIGLTSKADQEVKTIQPTWTDTDIIKAVTSGVDISHFGENKGYEGELEKLVVNQNQLFDRLNPTIKTELIGGGVTQSTNAVFDKAKVLGELMLNGVTAKAGKQYLNAKTADDLDGLDIEKIAKVLGVAATPQALLDYKQ